MCRFEDDEVHTKQFSVRDMLLSAGLIALGFAFVMLPFRPHFACDVWYLAVIQQANFLGEAVVLASGSEFL